jgi:hypothetical protein
LAADVSFVGGFDLKNERGAVNQNHKVN